MVGTIDQNGSILYDFGTTITSPSSNLQLFYNIIYPKLKFESKVPFMQSGFIENYIHNAGIRYYFTDSFDVTGELLYAQPQTKLTLINIPSGDPYGWSVMGRYRFDNVHTLYAGYDVWYLNSKDKDGTMTQALTGKRADSMYSKTWTVGYKINWGEKKDKFIKIQYIKGEGLGSAPASWTKADWTKTGLEFVKEFN